MLGKTQAKKRIRAHGIIYHQFDQSQDFSILNNIKIKAFKAINLYILGKHKQIK